MDGSPYPAAFITYGWCRSCYAAIRSLSNNGIRVHVGDASGLAMGRFSRHTISFSRLPDFFRSPNDYVTAVVAAMGKTGARVLLPSHEDVGLFCKQLHRQAVAPFAEVGSLRLAGSRRV